MPKDVKRFAAQNLNAKTSDKHYFLGVISTGQSTPYACTIKSYLKSGATSCSSFSLETYGKLTDYFVSFLFFNRMVK
jgi:hypothetical protein